MVLLPGDMKFLIRSHVIPAKEGIQHAVDNDEKQKTPDACLRRHDRFIQDTDLHLQTKLSAHVVIDLFRNFMPGCDLFSKTII